MTTDAQAALAQVREALAAGPTPREWLIAGEDKSFVYSLGPHGTNAFWAHVQAAGPERISEAEKGANAKLIAACSPENIAALLAEIDRLREQLSTALMDGHDMAKNEYRDEIERLTALLADRDEREAKIARERDEARIERDAMADVLPGYYYMDPPDGGDVPVLEQLRRMAKDAARYRLLRRKFAIISDSEGHAEFCPINLPRPTYIAPNAAIELDTALDRERLGLDGTRPPTPVGWSDTDWIKRLQEQDEQPHPLAGQHINQGSMDAAADAYEAEYNAARGISEADKD